MKTLPSLLLLGLFALGAPLSAAETDSVGDDWVRLKSESLPSDWADFYEQIRSRPWVEADFVERRFFSFRRGAVPLTGTVWFGREEGLTLAYRMPRTEVMRIDEDGVRIIRENRPDRSPRIPEEGQRIPDMLLALFRFDLERIEENFEVRGRREGNAWSLRLVPHDREGAPIQRVKIGGIGTDVTDIEIEQERSRRIELELSNIAYPTSLDQAELARRFP